MPTISVIIATRNRPVPFAAALTSVLQQTKLPLEVVVINDGSDGAHKDAYERVIAAGGELVHYSELSPRPKGHGPSYALNVGVSWAKGDYIAFLDDDDSWIDSGHLERALAAIGEAKDPIDVYMTNQLAFVDGERKSGPIWIEDLEPLLQTTGRSQDRLGSYSVTFRELLQCTGFCHLNTLIVRRELFDSIGGFDEEIRWEGDRDLFLRLIDRAREIKYAPFAIARHNIPDPAKGASVTTALSDFQRRLYQLRLLDRAILFAGHREIREYARLHKGYTLKRIAEGLIFANRREEAAFYAREALGAQPNLKWLAYTVWHSLRARFSKRAR